MSHKTLNNPTEVCTYNGCGGGYEPLPIKTRTRFAVGDDGCIDVWRNADGEVVVRGSSAIAVRPSSGNEVRVILLEW